MVTLADGASIPHTPTLPIEAQADIDHELDIINNLVGTIRAQALVYANGVEADVHLHLQTSYDDTKWMMSFVIDEERSAFALATAHNILFTF